MRTRPFLAAARAQLDADHFGLEKIKKRLIEYLAVVRLKELNAEREAQETALKEASEGTQSAKMAPEATAQETKDGKELVAYDKNQQPQPRVQPSPGKPSRNGKKGVKGPILL